MSGGGGGTNTTTEQVSFPSQLEPYIQPFMSAAQNLYSQPYQPYTGQQVAPLTDLQNQAIGMTQNIANSSNAQLGTAQSALQNLINGGSQIQPGTNPLLGVNNPYLQNAVGQAQQDVVNSYQNATAPDTDAAFARAGAFGGSAWQNAVTQNQHQLNEDLGNVATNMQMQDYGNQEQLQENNVNRQMQAQGQNTANLLSAIGATPALSQAGYQNASALNAVGTQQQQQNQNELNSAYQDFLTQQQYPYQQLGILQGALGTLLGAGGHDVTQTSSNPNATNPVAQGLGLGLGGLGAASQLGLLGSGAIGSLPGVGGLFAGAGLAGSLGASLGATGAASGLLGGLGGIVGPATTLLL